MERHSTGTTNLFEHLVGRNIDQRLLWLFHGSVHRRFSCKNCQCGVLVLHQFRFDTINGVQHTWVQDCNVIHADMTGTEFKLQKSASTRFPLRQFYRIFAGYRTNVPNRWVEAMKSIFSWIWIRIMLGQGAEIASVLHSHPNIQVKNYQRFVRIFSLHLRQQPIKITATNLITFNNAFLNSVMAAVCLIIIVWECDTFTLSLFFLFSDYCDNHYADGDSHSIPNIREWYWQVNFTQWLVISKVEFLKYIFYWIMVRSPISILYSFFRTANFEIRKKYFRPIEPNKWRSIIGRCFGKGAWCWWYSGCKMTSSEKCNSYIYSWMSNSCIVDLSTFE